MGSQVVTVLVVEDEFLIRAAIADQLVDAGFKVLSAAHADEAIQILEAHREITLLFTDIHMPGSMDGLQLAAAVRDRWPPVHIIVTSGHMPVSQADLPTGGLFFSKPYDISALTTAMRNFVQPLAL